MYPIEKYYYNTFPMASPRRVGPWREHCLSKIVARIRHLRPGGAREDKFGGVRILSQVSQSPFVLQEQGMAVSVFMGCRFVAAVACDLHGHVQCLP